jgi:peroxiredoxin
MISCNSDTPKETETTTNDTMTTSLGQILAEKKAHFEANADEAKKTLYNQGIQAVVDAGVLERAKNVGDEAPNFTLKNANGESVNLKTQLKNGPVILMWYRGGWCPYCNLTLKSMQDHLAQFTAAGAQLIALTPELPDSSLSTKEKNNLQFEVLSDLKNTIAKQYGVVFTLTPEVAKKYQEGFGLHQYNGDESNELPLAATYIIGTDGKIKYAFLDADYRNRAEPAEILKHLK